MGNLIIPTIIISLCSADVNVMVTLTADKDNYLAL